MACRGAAPARSRAPPSSPRAWGAPRATRRGAAFHRGVFLANFAEDRDIGDPAVLRDVLSAAGQDADAPLARAVAPDTKQALRDRGAEAALLGIFGAPDFVVDGELFFGQDRLDDALAWATR
jgi:2-hydroxychromene-2-carboxylate isomerase